MAVEREAWNGPRVERVSVHDRTAELRLSTFLSRHLRALLSPEGVPLVICIGTDRSTGDSLGPLVGTFLSEKLPGLPVFGTLEYPVHAGNLVEVLERVKGKYSAGVAIAIDACLGRNESVGSITAGVGPLKPGAGVNKDLPSVGSLYITGTVNVGGFMEYLVLQNTRLNLVMKMAQVVTRAINEALLQLNLPASSVGGSTS
ncbi:MAG: spore protease YyaC [Firmicutes bacterium]|nr:spore protease YyaC [Bacillota bacterium]MCL5040530.1 spore protease YyaC [Bacillota bacterium]